MKKIKIHSPELRLQTVCSLNDAAVAELVKGTLLDHGIECELSGKHQAGFTGLIEIDVLIRESDTEKAREILMSHYPDACGSE